MGKFFHIMLFGILFLFGPNLVTFTQGKTNNIKKLITDIDKDRVISEASKYLLEKAITITADKAERSAGGVHDYFSEGDYWWPNPDSLEGPYIRKDGLTNPNNFVAHREVMRRFSMQASTLVAAYKFTGDMRFVIKALEHINAWFVNQNTMMFPQLKYAQAIKGISTGRGIGIIDTIHLVEIVQAIMVLEKAGLIKAEELSAIKDWFTKYSEWLFTDQFGIDERDNGNNHSICWNMQVAQYSKFIGDEKKIAFCREQFKKDFLVKQMASDGSFPLELKRTKPYGYSLFTLDAITTVAQILTTTSDNLWEYHTEDGKNIQAAVDFIFPYIKDKTKWPYQKDVMYFDDWPVRQPSLLFAAISYKEQKYLSLWEILNPAPIKDEILRNYFLRQPILWVE